MEHPVSTVDTPQHQGVVRPVHQFDVAAMRAVGHGHRPRVHGSPVRAHADYELEPQLADLIEEGSGFKTAVRQDAHPEPAFDAVWDGSEKLTGQGHRG